MSLMRLLTSGKALVTQRDLPSAYRLRRTGWLPKFGLGRDPFAVKEPVAVAEVPTASSVAVTGGATERKSIWPWGARKAGGQGMADLSRVPKTRTHAAKDTHQTVQGELTLDTVKVVRNDLRGSDVDLVMRPSGADAHKPQVGPRRLLIAMNAEKALDRLADRIVGAETR